MPRLPTLNRAQTIEASVPGANQVRPDFSGARNLQVAAQGLQDIGNLGMEIGARLKRARDSEYVYKAEEDLSRIAEDNFEELKKKNPDGFGVTEEQSKFVDKLLDDYQKNAPSKKASRDLRFKTSVVVQRHKKQAEQFERTQRNASSFKTLDGQFGSLENELVLNPSEDRLFEGITNGVTYIQDMIQNGQITLAQGQQIEKQKVTQAIDSFINGRFALMDREVDSRRYKTMAQGLLRFFGQGVKLRADELRAPMSVEEARMLGFSDKEIASFPKDGDKVLVGGDRGENIPVPETPGIGFLARYVNDKQLSRIQDRVARGIKLNKRQEMADLTDQVRELTSAYDRNELPSQDVHDATLDRLAASGLPANKVLENSVELEVKRVATSLSQDMVYDSPQQMAQNVKGASEQAKLITDRLIEKFGTTIPKELMGKSLQKRVDKRMRLAAANVLEEREKNPAGFFVQNDPLAQQLEAQVFVPDPKTNGNTMMFNPAGYVEYSRRQNVLQKGANVSAPMNFSPALKERFASMVQMAAPEQVVDMFDGIQAVNPNSFNAIMSEVMGSSNISGRAAGPKIDNRFSLVSFLPNRESKKKAVELIRSNIKVEDRKIKDEVSQHNELGEFRRILNNLPSGSNDGVALSNAVEDLVAERAQEIRLKNPDKSERRAVDQAVRELVSDSFASHDYSSVNSRVGSNFYTPAMISVPGRRNAIDLRDGIGKQVVEEFVENISDRDVIRALDIPVGEQFMQQAKSDGLTEQEARDAWERQLSKSVAIRNAGPSLDSFALMRSDGEAYHPILKDGKPILFKLQDILQQNTSVQSISNKKARELRRDEKSIKDQQNIILDSIEKQKLGMGF